MKEIKRLGFVKITKSWEIIGKKKLKRFINSYPYLKRWFVQEIKRPNIQEWKRKAQIRAYLMIFPKEYLVSLKTMNIDDDKYYSYLLKKSKREIIKNNVYVLYDYLVEEEDGH